MQASTPEPLPPDSGGLPISARPIGLTLLAIFFGAGALASGLSAAALAFPGSWLEPMWRLNPAARVEFARLGSWAVLLMLVVALACGGAAMGVWTGRRWGQRLAVGVLGCNLLGDLLNALVRGDRRTLIGLPIGGAMLVYLLSRRVHGHFTRAGFSIGKGTG